MHLGCFTLGIRFSSCYGGMAVGTVVRIFLVFVCTACPTVQKIILLCILYHWPVDGPRCRNVLPN